MSTTPYGSTGLLVPPYLQQYTTPGDVPSGSFGSSTGGFKGIFQNTSALPEAAFSQRNIAVSNLLKQLEGPSFADLYASGLIDTLARQYSQALRSQKSALSSRGLLGSGVESAGSRELLGNYSKGVIGATEQSSTQEQQRKQSLLNSLIGIEQSDVGKLGKLIGGELGVKGAKASEDILYLQNIFSDLFGGIQVAGTALGAYAGASGGLSGVGSSIGGPTGSALSSGGLQGGIAGAQLGSQISSGNFGSLAPSPYQYGGMGQGGYPMGGYNTPSVSYGGGYGYTIAPWQTMSVGSIS